MRNGTWPARVDVWCLFLFLDGLATVLIQRATNLRQAKPPAVLAESATVSSFQRTDRASPTSAIAKDYHYALCSFAADFTCMR